MPQRLSGWSPTPDCPSVVEGAEPLPGPLTLSRSPRGSTVAVLRPRPLLTAVPVLWSPSEALSCLALVSWDCPHCGGLPPALKAG